MARYLSNESDPNAFEGTAYVFDGPSDFHDRIDDETAGMDADAILVMRDGRPDRLSGGGRGGEYATASLSHQTRGSTSCVHW